MPEPWGTWIDGHNAQLLIPLPKSEIGLSPVHELVLEVRPLINAAHPELRASYQVNNAKSQSLTWHWQSTSPANLLHIPITSDDLAKGYLDIQLHIDNPISPKSWVWGRMSGFRSSSRVHHPQIAWHYNRSELISAIFSNK